MNPINRAMSVTPSVPVLRYVFKPEELSFSLLYTCKLRMKSRLRINFRNNKQLLDEVEQNIVICLWRADQLFADAEGRGK